jgi:hypothetical protein
MQTFKGRSQELLLIKHPIYPPLKCRIFISASIVTT